MDSSKLQCIVLGEIVIKWGIIGKEWINNGFNKFFVAFHIKAILKK